MRTSIRSEWDAIAARIDGLVAASTVYLSACVIGRDDPYGAADKALIPEAFAIVQEAERFVERHMTSLPDGARLALLVHTEQARECLRGKPSAFQGVKALVPRLAALRAIVDYHLVDFSATAKRIAERAFQHLQRSIIANQEVAKSWVEAYAAGEPACEKLGAAHLLLHGIWAFKADAEGERTDLILGEPPNLADVEASADALVLTEWKRVTSGSPEAAAREARAEASLYASGSLGALELSTYRYVVLVSEGRLEPISDHAEGAVTYRHINVAVRPSTPSKQARKARARG